MNNILTVEESKASAIETSTNDIAIKVENLYKIYKLYNNPLERLKESLHPFKKKYHKEFYALHDVNFEVKRGETVGIIGKNGSGKSTLLKIITGVLTPSSGNVVIKGRISALLELGTGFNPEFTGIENIYFSCTIMGYTREEIDNKIEEIIDFADIGEFVNQPVKTYSSGMYIRLAFAVAISIEPDILIVDEALSVGDEAFQRKCFSRIQRIQECGATILFVSHSAGTILELCERVILFDNGEIILKGLPKLVVSKYHQLLYSQGEKKESLRNQFKDLDKTLDKDILTSVKDKGLEKKENILKEFYDPVLIPKSKIVYSDNNDYGVKIFEPVIVKLDGEKVNNLIFNKEYIYKYKVSFSSSSFNVRFGMLFKTVTGYELSGFVSANTYDAINIVEEGSIINVEFRFKCLLHPGIYFANAGVLGIINTEEVFLDRIIDAIMFRVQPEEDFLGKGIASLLIEADYTIERSQKFLQEA